MHAVIRTGRLAFVGALLAVAWSGPLAAQDTLRRAGEVSIREHAVSPAIRDLRTRIERSPAIAIQPLPAGDTVPEVRPAPVEVPPAAPESAAMPEPAAAPAAPVAASEPLRPGHLRLVTLSRLDEQATSEIARAALPQAMREQAVVFQGAVRTVDEEARELILKAVAFPRAPLRFNPSRGRFEGGVSVGVIEVGGSGTRTLSAPIAFQILGPVATEPETVSVARTAPPYRDIVVAADAPEAQLKVTVVSNVAPAGEELALRVRPSLALTVTPSRIQGWGLETAEVLVGAQAADAGRDNRVQLASTQGRLSTTTLSLDAAGEARATIRSESVGAGTLTARGGGLDGASATVDYAFPWRFLGAALIGGLAGGLLRGRSRSRASGALARSLGAAVLSAAVVVGLYVLGVNLVGFALPAHGGEVLVFVVAALGALYGSKLLTARPLPP
jgi:hypothetical protein